MGNTNSSKRVAVTCPKCAGKRKIFGFSHYANGDCFECGATGVVWCDAAAIAAAKANAEMQAAARAADHAAELYELECYDEAARAIAAHGMDGARRYFAAHRTDGRALNGLIGAMRDQNSTRWDDASNAIVAYMREHNISHYARVPAVAA